MDEDLEARLIAIIAAAPRLMRVLAHVRAFALPQGLIASGAIFQTAWNALTGRDPDYGVKDFDLLYFDPDTSYEAEDEVIKRVAAALPDDLRPLVEVRNQARVHLWFEQKFGEPYAPLTSSAEALTRFVSRANAVGAWLDEDERIQIAAPFGLQDLFAMRLRPTPVRPRSPAFARITEALRARWPELTIE
jgi:hypothetical protein